MKTWVDPSSIVTGIETSIAFLQEPRTETRFESISKVSATRLSCSRASSIGFSRRWDVPTAATVRSLARCVRVEGEIAGIRNRLGEARGRGDHRRVVGAEGERRGGGFGERRAKLGVR